MKRVDNTRNKLVMTNNELAKLFTIRPGETKPVIHNLITGLQANKQDVITTENPLPASLIQLSGGGDMETLLTTMNSTVSANTTLLENITSSGLSSITESGGIITITGTTDVSNLTFNGDPGNTQTRAYTDTLHTNNIQAISDIDTGTTLLNDLSNDAVNFDLSNEQFVIDINDLTISATTITNQINNIDLSIVDLSNSSVSISQNVNMLNESMELLDTSVSVLLNSVDILDTSFGLLNAQFITLSGVVYNQDISISELTMTTNTQSISINELSLNQNMLDNSFTWITTKQTNIDASNVYFTDYFTTADTSFVTVFSNIDAIDASIGSIEGDVVDVSTNFWGLSNRLNILELSRGEFDASISSLNRSVALLSNVEETSTNIGISLEDLNTDLSGFSYTSNETTLSTKLKISTLYDSNTDTPPFIIENTNTDICFGIIPGCVVNYPNIHVEAGDCAIFTDASAFMIGTVGGTNSGLRLNLTGGHSELYSGLTISGELIVNGDISAHSITTNHVYTNSISRMTNIVSHSSNYFTLDYTNGSRFYASYTYAADFTLTITNIPNDNNRVYDIEFTYVGEYILTWLTITQVNATSITTGPPIMTGTNTAGTSATINKYKITILVTSPNTTAVVQLLQYN